MLLNEFTFIILIFILQSTSQLPLRNRTSRRKEDKAAGRDFKNYSPSPTLITDSELNDSLEQIQTLSENGRLVLLACKSRCSKQRAEIPKWLEEYNVEYNTSSKGDIINYHFHPSVYPIERHNIDKEFSGRSPLLLYIIGPHAIVFKNELITKAAFWKWLILLEKAQNSANYQLIFTEFEINGLLNNVSRVCKYKNSDFDYLDDNFGNSRETDDVKSYNKSADSYEYILEPATSWERRRLAKTARREKVTDLANSTEEVNQHLEVTKKISSERANERLSRPNTYRYSVPKKGNRINDLYRRQNYNRRQNTGVTASADHPSNRYRRRREELNNTTIVQLPPSNDLRRRKALLFVHHPDICPIQKLDNFIRTLRDDNNVSVSEIRRPLIVEVDVILRQRLIGLQYKCQMIILLNNNAFMQLPSEPTVTELHNFAKTWHSEHEDACKRDLTPFERTYRIRSSLTDAEMIYYKEEVLIQRIEFSHAFVIVGVVGGLAVVALAISIFWGLNGTSFVSK